MKSSFLSFLLVWVVVDLFTNSLFLDTFPHNPSLSDAGQFTFHLDMQHIYCTIKNMTGKQLKKLLEEHGWCLDRISGSHHIMICEGRRSIPIPIHGATDLPKGLLSAILKQAGIKE